MHLARSRPVEEIQKLYDICITSRTLKGVASPIETENESIWNPWLPIDVWSAVMLVYFGTDGHCVG